MTGKLIPEIRTCHLEKKRSPYYFVLSLVIGTFNTSLSSGLTPRINLKVNLFDK